MNTHSLSLLSLALRAAGMGTHIAQAQAPVLLLPLLRARTTTRSPAEQQLAHGAAAVRRAMRQQRNLLREGKTGEQAL